MEKNNNSNGSEFDKSKIEFTDSLPIQKFSEDEIFDVWCNLKNKKGLFSNILAKNNPLSKLKSEIFTVFSLLKDYFTGKYTAVSWKTIALLLGTIMYILNPVDLVPDFFYPIGWLDDLSLTCFVLKYIHEDYVDYKTWKMAKDYNNHSNNQKL